MSKLIELKNTTHNFVKTNLVTLSGNQGSYDEMRCESCGLKGKRKVITHVEVDGRTSMNDLEKCPKVAIKVPTKVKITNFTGFSANFANLTSGSIHDVIEPPEQYKTKYPNCQLTVWVDGVSEPSRLLSGEFEVIEW